MQALASGGMCSCVLKYLQHCCPAIVTHRSLTCKYVVLVSQEPQQFRPEAAHRWCATCVFLRAIVHMLWQELSLPTPMGNDLMKVRFPSPFIFPISDANTCKLTGPWLCSSLGNVDADAFFNLRLGCVRKRTKDSERRIS